MTGIPLLTGTRPRMIASSRVTMQDSAGNERGARPADYDQQGSASGWRREVSRSARSAPRTGTTGTSAFATPSSTMLAAEYRPRIEARDRRIPNRTAVHRVEPVHAPSSRRDDSDAFCRPRPIQLWLWRVEWEAVVTDAPGRYVTGASVGIEAVT